MAGTMQGLYVRHIPLSMELYERLNKLPIRVVERFRDLNEKKYSFFDAISIFRTKREINILTANKVLEERIKTQ
jgi:hypothetical protein